MKIQAQDDASKTVKVTLDGNTARISAGGNGSDGEVELFDAAGQVKVWISASVPGDPNGRGEPAGNVFVDGTAASLRLRAETQGTIPVVPAEARIDPHSIVLQRVGTRQSVNIDGSRCNLAVNDFEGKESVKIDGQKSRLTLGDNGQNRILLDGSFGYGALGGAGQDGSLAVFAADAAFPDSTRASVVLNGGLALVTVGNNVVLDGNKANKSAEVKAGNILIDGSPGTKSAVMTVGSISIDGSPGTGSALVKVGNISIDGKAGTISANGNIIAEGTHSERRKVLALQQQSVTLFSLGFVSGQPGAYMVELAACYGKADPGIRWYGYSCRRWIVFTYPHTLASDPQFDAVLLINSEDGYPKPFWNADPSLSVAGSSVQLSISDVPNLAKPSDGAATLSVQALFGAPPAF